MPINFRLLLPVLISTILLLWIPRVYTQDVLTITTSLPYVFNGTRQYDLICTVSPLKAMTFRWEGIDCNQREKLVGGDRCKFTPSQSNNRMTVMCIASYETNGSISEISNFTTLNVQYPPSTPPDITTNIIGDTMYVNRSYRLTCTIMGGNPLPTIYFGCAPFSKYHSGGVWSSDGYIVREYDINPAVLGDDGAVCKCTGLWTQQPLVYTLSASVTLRVVDLSGNTVPFTSRTTLSERTSSLSESETVTFTPRTSSWTSSEAPIRGESMSQSTITLKTDLNASAPLGVPVTPYTHATQDIAPDDNFKSNVFIGFGIMGMLLLACIIIGVFGLRMFLNKRENKPQQNGAAPSEEPYLIDSAQSGYNYDSISSLKSDRSTLPLHDCEIKPHFLHLENGSYITADPLNV